MKAIIDYLKAAGASGIEEVRPFLWQFRLPGDHHPLGRVTTTRDGRARIWHKLGALDLPESWKTSDPIRLKSGVVVPSYIAHISDLRVGDRITRVSKISHYIAASSEIEDAACRLLESYGWKRGPRANGVISFNDGTGESYACRLAVSEGIATVWSWRSDVDLPSPPWRPGKTLEGGMKSMYATARDLGVAVQAATHAPSPPKLKERDDEIDPAFAASIKKLWDEALPAPRDHRHLTKANAVLDPFGLRVFPPDHPFVGDLIIPVFRPAPDSRYALEIAGAQRLCIESHIKHGSDKFFVSGTKLSGSFVPVPFDRLANGYHNGLVSFDRWLDRTDESKPLVVCEGVASALAIHQAGAGNAIAALSSSNLIRVAQWLREQGHADRFPALVIAADLDLSVRDGKPVSRAIEHAIEAANAANALVAVAPAGMPNGTDARDLLGIGGAESVVDYIEGASHPANVIKRNDIGNLLGVHHHEKRKSCEIAI